MPEILTPEATEPIELVKWLCANGFVPSTSPGFMEIAWSHSSGHDYMTLRLDFVNGRDSGAGYALVIHVGNGEPAICVGYTRNVEDIQRLHAALAGLEYQPGGWCYALNILNKPSDATRR